MISPSEIQPLEPIDVVDLFLPERESLLRLLTALTDEQWDAPTVCPGWSVRDVALHVLGVDFANLSRRRDGWRDAGNAGPSDDPWPALVEFINQFNQQWVEAARRISPRLMYELLAFTAEPVTAYFRSLDLTAMGEPVGRPGPCGWTWRESTPNGGFTSSRFGTRWGCRASRNSASLGQ
jgi:uncharacterized protein (TIGR03083 family)